MNFYKKITFILLYLIIGRTSAQQRINGTFYQLTQKEFLQSPCFPANFELVSDSGKIALEHSLCNCINFSQLNGFAYPEMMGRKHLGDLQMLEEENEDVKYKILYENCNKEPFLHSEYINVAFINYKLATQIARRIPDSTMLAKNLASTGWAYLRFGNNDKSLQNFEESFHIATELNQKTLIADALHGMARIYLDHMQINPTANYLKKATKIYRSSRDSIKLSKVLIDLGHCQIRSHDTLHAMTSYEEALRINNKIGSPADIANNFIGFLIYHTNWGSLDEADCYASEMIRLSKLSKNRKLEGHGLFFKGVIKTKQEQNGKALEFFILAQNIKEFSNKPKYERLLSAYLAQLYSEIGKYELAFSHLENVEKIRFNSYSADLILRLQEKIQILESERDAKTIQNLSEKEKGMQIILLQTKAKLKIQKTIKNILIIFSSISLLVLGFILFLLKIIRKEKVRAERSERKMEKFLATMSHEIRTPIFSMLNSAHLLHKQPQKDRQERLFSIIENSGNHLLDVINKILDLSAMDSGQIQLEETSFLIQPLLNDLASDFSQQAHSKGLDFFMDISSLGVNQLLGDPRRLKQILINILANAVKYTKQGKISLFAKIRNSDINQLWISFIVSDTGIGIRKEDQKLIFSSYTQVSLGETNFQMSSGLGLAITKNLVALMGGEISLISEFGKGSSFTISLPFRKSNVAENKKLIEKEIPLILLRKKILIVDDHNTNRLLITEVIQMYLPKSKVISLRDGKTAFELLKKEQFDLILMDLNMKGWDGFKTTIEIRKLSQNPNQKIPILGFSANNREGVIDRCRKSGMNGFIPKPVKIDLMISSIFDCLSFSSELSAVIPPDGKIMEIIAAEGGSEKHQKFLRRFFDSNADELQIIQSKIVSQDRLGLENSLHRLKTNMAYLEEGKLWTKIEKLEKQISSQNSFSELVPELKEIEILVKEYQQLLEKRII